jgi:hypothetical protein
VTRSSMAIWTAVSALAAVSAVQWWVTSPGVITYAEMRLIVLAGIPAMVTVISARWVENGRRNR